MASSLHIVALLVVLTQMISIVIPQKADPLIKLTDDNWREVLEGEWMVEFMAPWCPACLSFQSTWQGFADWSRSLDINVAVVDVTESPGLNGRFFVTSLPTILHVKDGEFRQYTGPRKENELVSFVDDKKWNEMEPVTAWYHPNSLQMGALGEFFKVALTIRNFYNLMTSEYGIPEWACYIIFAVITLLVGLLLGLMIVLCCDCIFPPKQRTVLMTTTENQIEEDDDSDVIVDDEEESSEPVTAEQTGDSSVRRRQNVAHDSSALTADS